MFASRFFLSFLALGALSASSAPTPNNIERRADITNVLGIVGTLQGQTGAILPEIQSLVSNGFASQQSLTPLVNGLVSALNTASSSVTALGTVNSASGGSTADVANAVAPIVQQITSTLSNAQTAVPGLSTVLGTVGFDASLNQFLTGLEIALAGVLNLVSSLLVDIAGALSTLALGLVLASLGL